MTEALKKFRSQTARGTLKGLSREEVIDGVLAVLEEAAERPVSVPGAGASSSFLHHTPPPSSPRRFDNCAICTQSLRNGETTDWTCCDHEFHFKVRLLGCSL